MLASKWRMPTSVTQISLRGEIYGKEGNKSHGKGVRKNCSTWQQAKEEHLRWEFISNKCQEETEVKENGKEGIGNKRKRRGVGNGGM